MIAVSIPGFGDLELHHLVLDYNGTLALDGSLLPAVGPVLTAIATELRIHVVTGDTFGLAAAQLTGLPLELTLLGRESQAEAKRALVESLGPARVVAIGNGRNDRLLLATAALGIALIQKEGGAVMTVADADIVCTDILDALGLLQYPQRLVATLRS